MKKKHARPSGRSVPEKNSPRRGKKRGELVRGLFSSSQAGFGFLHPDAGGADIFIPPSGAGRAIDGDVVEAEVFSPDADGYLNGRPSKGPIGFIRNVIERGRKTFVGRLDTRHSVVPMSRSLPDSIPVNSVPKGAKQGDWVRLRLLNDGPRHTETLRGTVEERIASAGTVQGDLDAVVAEYGLEGPYSREQETAALRLKPRETERTDLRSLFTVTIDPADAHDFDDAISLDPDGPNQLKIGVHIADIAAWIAPGSTFDKLARQRAFSAYLPGRFLPMLPRTLTEKISLREGEDSAAHSVIFTVRQSDGRILSVRRVHSRIRVDRRLAFPEVQELLSGHVPDGWSRELRDRILLLAKMAGRLRARRLKREQFLDMPVPEIRVECREDTLEITGILRRDPSEADRIVEEFMLAANSAVAEETAERHLPSLYRVHPEPEPERIEDFSSFARDSFGIRTGDLLSSRGVCLDFLSSLPDDHRKPILLSAFLRALPRASYASAPSLHYGLGKIRYSHFTSPIRRYSDLLVHQQLWNADANRRFLSGRAMEEFAVYCSKKEEANDAAFFAANDRLKLHYLRVNRVMESGKLHEAVIAKVTAGGLVCSIPDYGLYGFVPSSFLRGGEYRRTRIGRHAKLTGSHESFRPGDFIYLILDSLDFVRGRAVFRPAV